MTTFTIYYNIEKSNSEGYNICDMEKVIVLDDEIEIQEAKDNLENVYYFQKYLDVVKEDGYDYEVTIDSISE